MLMVVESDGVHMKELPYIAQDISVRDDNENNDDNETIYIPGENISDSNSQIFQLILSHSWIYNDKELLPQATRCDHFFYS